MSDEALALVIEDDFDASVIFAKALEVLGFQTEQIAEGDKALARLKETVPEIIVLDLHLPQVLGTNIIRSIRADERLKDTLVIIASADPRSADLVQDMADLVLIKPTTFSQVRDLAGRLTSSRRKKREAAAKAKTQEIPDIQPPVAEPTTPPAETAVSAPEPTVKAEDAPPAEPQPASPQAEPASEGEPNPPET
ncbi:MAG: response regulator [Chloroflexi bacterium]|nr:MAG: response regulator [Chloroflexota bacterium]